MTARGIYAIASSENPKVFFWAGMNEEFSDAIIELLREGKIHYGGSSIFEHLVVGKCLTMPIMKSNRIYKTDHWCPAAVCIGRGEK